MSALARWRCLLLPLLLAAGCGQAPPLAVSSPTPAPTATPIIIVVVVTATPAPTTAASATAIPVTPTPQPLASATPGPERTAAPASTATPGSGGTFRVCAAPDPATAQAIASLIAGRGFTATLTGQGGGCAQLAITVTPGSFGGGKQSTNLSVDGISVQIVTENGQTQVHIGAQP